VKSGNIAARPNRCTRGRRVLGRQYTVYIRQP